VTRVRPQKTIPEFCRILAQCCDWTVVAERIVGVADFFAMLAQQQVGFG
jgi:hypothetical protein